MGILFSVAETALYYRGVEVSPSAPPTHPELTQLPPSIENIDAKLNHLIVRTEYGIKASERAERTAERARELAGDARTAAMTAGTHALRAAGLVELPKTQRLIAVGVGAVLGGAMMSFLMQTALLAASAYGLASCLPGR